MIGVGPIYVLFLFVQQTNLDFFGSVAKFEHNMYFDLVVFISIIFLI